MEPQLHVFFLPFHARSHTLSIVDTARLFAQRGVRCTVVSTAGNSSYIRATIEHAKHSEGLPIDLALVPFPAAEAGLPVGVECTDSLQRGQDYDFDTLYQGMYHLRHPIGRLISELRPDCIVTDSLLFWNAHLAHSLSIPLFQLVVFSPFSKAVYENIFTSGALAASAGKDTVGPLSGLPHPVECTAVELPVNVHDPQCLYFKATSAAEAKCCGIMFNSFDELAPEYVEHCRRVTLTGKPMKVWCIGPLQLYKAGQDAGSWDGGMKIKSWLDSKRPESVLYVSFGSECFFSSEQLREIAVGLQSCEHSFVWVVRGGGGGADTMNEWLPPEFHEKVGNRGLILTEWAPQVAILNHRSAGGCIMHCGWNSCIETVCAGLPAIAWPLHSDHFVCERLVVEVLKMGVRILEGPKMRSVYPEGKGTVKAEAIRDAVDRLMGGRDPETRAMRETAKRYKGLARAAMAEGGSSHVNLGSVIEHMKMLVKEKK